MSRRVLRRTTKHADDNVRKRGNARVTNIVGKHLNSRVRLRKRLNATSDRGCDESRSPSEDGDAAFHGGVEYIPPQPGETRRCPHEACRYIGRNGRSKSLSIVLRRISGGVRYDAFVTYHSDELAPTAALPRPVDADSRWESASEVTKPGITQIRNRPCRIAPL